MQHCICTGTVLYAVRLNNKLNRFMKFPENRMKITKISICCIDEFTYVAVNITLSANNQMIIVIFCNFFSTYHFYMCLLVKFSKRKERPNMRIAVKLITTRQTLYSIPCEPYLTALKYGSQCHNKNRLFSFFFKLFRSSKI